MLLVLVATTAVWAASGAWRRVGTEGDWKETIAAAGFQGKLYTVEKNGTLYVTEPTLEKSGSLYEVGP